LRCAPITTVIGKAFFDVGHSLKAILALKPVTFHYKSDVKSIPCFGLVTGDVEKVNPDLVVRDKNGELSSVRYERLTFKEDTSC
jgi:hypothetical protein